MQRSAQEVVQRAAQKGLTLAVNKKDRRVMLTASMMDPVSTVCGVQACTTTDLGVYQRKTEVDGVAGTEVTTYVTTRNTLFIPDGSDVNAATAMSLKKTVQGIGDAVENLQLQGQTHVGRANLQLALDLMTDARRALVIEDDDPDLIPENEVRAAVAIDDEEHVVCPGWFRCERRDGHEFEEDGPGHR